MGSERPKYADKRILIGMTGGIACYKICELVRHFVKNGAEVRVVMTKNATEFVSPLTMETLSGYPVTTETFPKLNAAAAQMIGTHHIELAQWPDTVLIAPAGGNIVGKVAGGIADDVLTTVIMATSKPVLLALAMNDKMYLNPIVQRNIRTLREYNYDIIDPETGFLAEGYEGVGRLAELDRIVWNMDKRLFGEGILKDKKVLITAGPTHESIDPVRILTNHSSGKMGYALAREAALQGADVTLISGPTNLTAPSDINIIRVRSASEMAAAVEQNFLHQDIVVMAAAVADFAPSLTENQKIKKSDELVLRLTKTKDILADMGNRKYQRILVGFALETENELENAKEKLKNKNLDLIVLNNPKEKGAGFNTDTNLVTLVDRDTSEKLPLMSKDDVAKELIRKIAKLS